MNNGLAKVMGYMLDDLDPQTRKLKLCRQAVAQFNGEAALPDSFDEEDDLKEGLFQVLSEVIEGQELFCQKVTDFLTVKPLKQARKVQPHRTRKEDVMDKTEIITKEQCDKLLNNCFKINALSSALSEVTEGNDSEASTLADCIFDYNLQSIDILNNDWHGLAKSEDKEASENKPASQDSEA